MTPLSIGEAQPVGEDEAYVVTWPAGEAVVVVPKVHVFYSTALQHALTVRREAMLTGVCQCGASVDMNAAILASKQPGAQDGMVADRMEHEDDCVALDTYILPMLQRYRS